MRTHIDIDLNTRAVNRRQIEGEALAHAGRDTGRLQAYLDANRFDWSIADLLDEATALARTPGAFSEHVQQQIDRVAIASPDLRIH
mgnify:CR=1 FL=1